MYIYICVCTYDNIPYIYIYVCVHIFIYHVYKCVCTYYNSQTGGRTENPAKQGIPIRRTLHEIPNAPFYLGALKPSVDDIELTRTLVVVRVRGN